MESKGLARNIIKVGISNLFTILSGIIVGFVIPKIMGLEDYGYYKTFTLYVSYVGLFHLGFIDGIYLKYGGVSYDDFDKCQFQVGEIIDCKEVPKSKKLLCSQVKIGSQVKQILSGIKQYYSAEEMVGKKVMVLVNLKPRQLAGMTSEGMLLCAEDAEGNLALMKPEKDMPAGAEIC